MSNSLDLDQDRLSISPGLCTNCLKGLSKVADSKGERLSNTFSKGSYFKISLCPCDVALLSVIWLN